MTKTGIIEKLVELLNSMIGRVRGGAAYVSVCASFLFGLVSGNAIANCSTVGAITVPWMKDSGWPKPVAATMNAGNAGVGQSMPSCSALYLLVGLAEVSAVVSVGDAYVACLCAGAINIVLWVPIVVCLICFIVGRKNLPKNAGGWVDLLKSCHSSFCTVGGVLLFALAASNVLNAVGFDQDLALILQSLSPAGRSDGDLNLYHDRSGGRPLKRGRDDGGCRPGGVFCFCRCGNRSHLRGSSLYDLYFHRGRFSAKLFADLYFLRIG